MTEMVDEAVKIGRMNAYKRLSARMDASWDSDEELATLICGSLDSLWWSVSDEERDALKTKEGRALAEGDVSPGADRLHALVSAAIWNAEHEADEKVACSLWLDVSLIEEDLVVVEKDELMRRIAEVGAVESAIKAWELERAATLLDKFPDVAADKEASDDDLIAWTVSSMRWLVDGRPVRRRGFRIIEVGNAPASSQRKLLGNILKHERVLCWVLGVDYFHVLFQSTGFEESAGRGASAVERSGTPANAGASGIPPACPAERGKAGG